MAGQKGMGLLSLTLILPLEEMQQRIALYKEGIASATPVGKFVNDKAGVFTMVHVAENDCNG